MNPSESKPITEKEVTADRLRILLPSGTTLEEAEEMIQKTRNGDRIDTNEYHGPVDGSTGMGEWSTVLVREILDSKVPESADEYHIVNAEEELVTPLDASNHFSTCESEVLAGFVFKEQHIYKGINLQGSKKPLTSMEDRQLIESVEENGPVQFKARKKRLDQGIATRKTRRLNALDDA